MSLRIGLLGIAHVHAPSYVHCFRAHPSVDVVGVWDDTPDRGQAFGARWDVPFTYQANELLSRVDAVVIASENSKHAALAGLAIGENKHVLCEKPLATTLEDAHHMVEKARAAGVQLMTAFPCPFSPAFQAAANRIAKGEIGKIQGISATNHGKCPGGWFVDPRAAGGGALMDHVVHVADLLNRILGMSPSRVFAASNNRMLGHEVEDSAVVTVEYPNGCFATIDSSWSRPQSYSSWGDVTLHIVGEKGCIELNLFGQAFDEFREGPGTHHMVGFGSNLDRAMCDEFVAAILEKRRPKITGEDGVAALKVAIAALHSAESGTPRMVE